MNSKPSKNKEEVARDIVDCAFHLHRDLGPGLLETVYESVLAKLIQERSYEVERQKPIPISYAGFKFEEGFRADLIVEGLVLVELKSVENLNTVHAKQVLTYIRLLNIPIGLLINFGAANFKDGIKRIIQGHQSFTTSPLRVNQKSEL